MFTRIRAIQWYIIVWIKTHLRRYEAVLKMPGRCQNRVFKDIFYSQTLNTISHSIVFYIQHHQQNSTYLHIDKFEVEQIISAGGLPAKAGSPKESIFDAPPPGASGLKLTTFPFRKAILLWCHRLNTCTLIVVLVQVDRGRPYSHIGRKGGVSSIEIWLVVPCFVFYCLALLCSVFVLLCSA